MLRFVNYTNTYIHIMHICITLKLINILRNNCVRLNLSFTHSLNKSSLIITIIFKEYFLYINYKKVFNSYINNLNSYNYKILNNIEIFYIYKFI